MMVDGNAQSCFMMFSIQNDEWLMTFGADHAIHRLGPGSSGFREQHAEGHVNQCRGKYVCILHIVCHDLDVYTYSIPSASQYLSCNPPVANAKGYSHTLENCVEARSFTNRDALPYYNILFTTPWLWQLSYDDWSYRMALTTCCQSQSKVKITDHECQLEKHM